MTTALFRLSLKRFVLSSTPSFGKLAATVCHPCSLFWFTVESYEKKWEGERMRERERERERETKRLGTN